jgi:hypothetical protein
MEFLTWLEQSSLSSWIRESPSVWAYPTILFLHTLGLGLLVGASMVVDLRMLGYSRDLPLDPIKKFFPVMWFGFWINALSGVLLVMIDATSLLTNPLFYVKLGFIAIAVVSGRLIAKEILAAPVGGNQPGWMSSKMLAGTSLICWIGAITAGRLTAYVFSHTGLASLSR